MGVSADQVASHATRRPSVRGAVEARRETLPIAAVKGFKVDTSNNRFFQWR